MFYYWDIYYCMWYNYFGTSVLVIIEWYQLSYKSFLGIQNKCNL